MEARLVQTLYPISTDNKGGGIFNWILNKLGLETSVRNMEKSEVFDPKSLYFPWHLLKSDDDDTIYIIDRR